jgi:thiosulfate/3-mercaptopyruvate sulfurtransferase
MKNDLKKILIVLFSLFICLESNAQNEDIIIGTKQTEVAIQRGVIVWDVRDEKSYLDGHLPNAINIGDVLTTLRDPNKEDYLPTSQLKKYLMLQVLDFQKEVIVYGYRGSPNAYFALHMIHYFGGKRRKSSTMG